MIETKYKIGEKVVCHCVDGIITGIMIREAGCLYEFCYFHPAGDIKVYMAKECEIQAQESRKSP